MARRIEVEIVGDASSLERAFSKSARSAKRFDRQMSHVGRGVTAGTGIFQSLGRSIAFASAGFLGGVGLAAGIRAAFEEMSSMQKVSAQTASVLKSTGSIAGVSAKHVDALATSLLNLSGTDDEAIKSSENLLLTFTNIRNVAGKNNDIFDQATKSALDLSVRFGRSLSSSAITLGKALQDPVKGLTALRRTGLQFSAAQQKTIKTLAESGRILEAQKIILGEVRRQTEGAAAAYGQTLAGKLNIAKESLLNMGGAIATALLPSLTKSADQLDRWLKNPKNQKQVVDDFTTSIKVLAGTFTFLKHSMEGLGIIGGAAISVFKKAIDLASHLPQHAGQWARDLKDQMNTTAPGMPPAGALGPVSASRFGAAPGAAEAAAAARAAALAAKEARQARQARSRQANEAARQAALDRAEFEVEKTTATKTLKDDLAALRRYNALLTKRIKGGHKTLELEREQFRVQMQIADVLQQQRQARKKQAAALKGVDVTRFQKSARGQLVAVGGGGRTIHIGNLNLVGVRNVPQLEQELARRSKQRAHHRRGNR